MKTINDAIEINTPSEFIKIKGKIINNNIYYKTFKQGLKVNYVKVYFLLSLPFMFLISSIATVYYIEINFMTSLFSKIILAILISSFIGLVLHNMQNIMHAAIHYDLHPNRKINDIIANFTVGLFTACEVKQGRKIHSLHHAISGSVEDPESSYLQPLNLKRIISYFTGIEILKYILKIDKKIETNKKDELKLSDKIFYILNPHRFFSLSIHLIFLSFFYFTLSSYILIFAWIYGFFAFFPFFSSVQNVLEHGEKKDSREKKNSFKLKPVNRNFGSDLFSKYILGSYGTNKHALHRWDPTIHFLNVEETTDFLDKSNYSSTIENYEAEYLDTFKKVFN